MCQHDQHYCIFGLVAITITKEIQINGKELQELIQAELQEKLKAFNDPSPTLHVKLFVINGVDVTAYTNNDTYKIVPVFFDKSKDHNTLDKVCKTAPKWLQCALVVVSKVEH